MPLKFANLLGLCVAAALFVPAGASAATLPAGAGTANIAEGTSAIEKAHYRHRYHHPRHWHHYNHYQGGYGRCRSWRHECASRWGWGGRSFHRCLWRHGC